MSKISLLILLIGHTCVDAIDISTETSIQWWPKSYEEIVCDKHSKDKIACEKDYRCWISWDKKVCEFCSY